MENPFHRWIRPHPLRTALVGNDENSEFWSIHVTFCKDARGQKARALLALHETRELGAGRRRIVDTGAPANPQAGGRDFRFDDHWIAHLCS